MLDGVLTGNNVPWVIAHGGFVPEGILTHGYMWGLVTNGVIAVAFLAVAVLLAINLSKSGQWKGNILGVGTFALYVGCGSGHLVHFLQLAYPTLGIGLPFGLAARYEYNDWHPWVFDTLTMMAGIYYWMMRRKFPDLVSGAAVYEDLRHRQRKAIQIHDRIVQGLVRAQMALDLKEDQEGHAAVGETLEASKRIISDLLGQDDVREGGLRRKRDAGSGIRQAKAAGSAAVRVSPGIVDPQRGGERS